MRFTVPARHDSPRHVTNSLRRMMLPADLVLVRDAEFRKHCESFVDYPVFEKEFAVAYKKLTELGFKGAAAPWYKFW